MEIMQIKVEPLDFCGEGEDGEPEVREDHFDSVVIKEEDIKTELIEPECYFEIKPENILVTSPRTDGFLHLSSISESDKELASDSKEVLRCDKCQISYSNKASFKNHVNVCKKPHIRQSLPVLSDQSYREERRETVGEKMKRSIEILERSCFKDEHLDDDELTKGAAFKCNDCQESFRGVRRFARHAYAHTFVKQATDDLPHICADCGKEFGTKRLADHHVSSAATACSSAPRLFFPCHVCRKSFTRKDNLREHLRGHAGRPTHRKRYECTFCGRTFGGVSLLNIHQRTHVAEAKFICSTCRKTFSSNQSLKKHMRSHAGKKRPRISD